MPRNMSFAMTTNQFKAKTKTVTRRLGWWFLKPGDLVNGVKKSMGLKRGEQVEVLCMIEIKSVRKEPLSAITKSDVIKEGFPEWSPKQFIDMICEHYKIKPNIQVNRIEFEYIF